MKSIAERKKRTTAAVWRAGYADGSAQIHDGLVVITGTVSRNQAGRQQCISLLGLLNQRTTNLKNILLSLFLKLDVYSLGIISRAIFPLKELEEGLFKPHLQLLVLCWQSDLLCLVEISS